MARACRALPFSNIKLAKSLLASMFQIKWTLEYLDQRVEKLYRLNFTIDAKELSRKFIEGWNHSMAVALSTQKCDFVSDIVSDWSQNEVGNLYFC